MELDEIIHNISSGDGLAGQRLYNEISPVLEYNCMRLTETKEEGEDLMQDCFIKIMHNLDSFNGHTFEELRTWVRSVCINYVIDTIRKEKSIINTFALPPMKKIKMLAYLVKQQ